MESYICILIQCNYYHHYYYYQSSSWSLHPPPGVWLFRFASVTLWCWTSLLLYLDNDNETIISIIANENSFYHTLVVSMWDVSHRLWCLNTCSPARGASLEDCGSFQRWSHPRGRELWEDRSWDFVAWPPLPVFPLHPDCGSTVVSCLILWPLWWTVALLKPWVGTNPSFLKLPLSGILPQKKSY